MSTVIYRMSGLVSPTRTHRVEQMYAVSRWTWLRRDAYTFVDRFYDVSTYAVLSGITILTDA